MQKAERGAFLAANPFPRPWTDGLFYREKMRAIHRIAPERPGGDAAHPPRVLDVGGGRSGLCTRLYPGAWVTTLDSDASQLDAAAAHNLVGDACRLPFADETFDVVTLFDVLEHIDDDRTAAAEAWRVTRRGGWVLVSTPEADWHYPHHTSLARWCPHERELMAAWGHVRRGYSAAALEALFGAPPAQRAGFINPLTAWFHDIAFSHLGARRRRAAYALTALPAALGYLLHQPGAHASETACAWQRR